VLGPRRDRDVFRHLEAEDERWRRGVEQLCPILLAGKLIKRQVAADGGEGLGVFGKAILLELRARELAPRQVAIFTVDVAEPPSYFQELVPK
jgi:hypothetical protein